MYQLMSYVTYINLIFFFIKKDLYKFNFHFFYIYLLSYLYIYVCVYIQLKFFCMKNVHVFWSITYNTNGFESEQYGAKEEWKIRNITECHAIVERQRLSKDIVEYDSKPSEHDNIR